MDVPRKTTYPHPVLLVGFVLFVLAALPVVLLKFAMDYVRNRIEARWPDSKRAMAFSFWMGLLWPVALNVVLWTFLGNAIECQHRDEPGDKIVSAGAED